jgi:hypothetical protein
LGRTTSRSARGQAEPCWPTFDARAAMKRLDEVMGPHWACTYPLSDAGVLICEISLKIDGEWITRADGAGETQIEAEKGKASDAFKRASTRWGIGRYLYHLPKSAKNWDTLPKWATPEGYDEIIKGRA